MVKLDNVTEGVLDVINDNKFSQTGAFTSLYPDYMPAI